jgi:cytochrome c-type biogenesis protein CcsB
MSMLFFMSTAFYWIGMFSRGEGPPCRMIGSRIAWVAVAMALIGTLVRWYESYLIGPDVGHIPVSNLYEVFVMFCWMTARSTCTTKSSTNTRALGAFVMLVVSAAVGFLLWYTVVREAHEIQPLVPALKSWWMKLHVPANFIGYGTFALAAMVAFAYLIKQQATETRWYKLAPLWLLGVVLCFEPMVFRQNATEGGSSYWMVYFGISGADRGRHPVGPQAHCRALPSFEVLDDVMYKSIAVGFAFFTIATVLGALWAAEAWGGYWSWDPKETWALIVWLNYAAWLHMRLMKGLRGHAGGAGGLRLVGAGTGLVVTTLLPVSWADWCKANMFLRGSHLHSYGDGLSTPVFQRNHPQGRLRRPPSDAQADGGWRCGCRHGRMGGAPSHGPAGTRGAALAWQAGSAGQHQVGRGRCGDDGKAHRLQGREQLQQLL